MIVSPSECCSASAAAAGASPSAAERRPCEIGPFWMDSAGRSLASAWSHSLALDEIEKKGGGGRCSGQSKREVLNII